MGGRPAAISRVACFRNSGACGEEYGPGYNITSASDKLEPLQKTAEHLAAQLKKKQDEAVVEPRPANLQKPNCISQAASSTA